MARIWSGMHGIFHFQYPSASPVRHPPAGEAGRYPARAAARAAALRSWALGTFTIITVAVARDRNSILLLILLVSKTCQNAQANPPRRTAADRYCLRATAKGGELVLQTICQLHVTNFEFGAAAAVDPPFPFASIDATSWCARASAQGARDWPIGCCLAFSSTPLCQIIPLIPRCRLVYDSAAPVAHLAASRCIRAGGPAFRGLAGADCALAGDERRVDGCIHRPAHSEP